MALKMEDQLRVAEQVVSLLTSLVAYCPKCKHDALHLPAGCFVVHPCWVTYNQRKCLSCGTGFEKKKVIPSEDWEELKKCAITFEERL